MIKRNEYRLDRDIGVDGDGQHRSGARNAHGLGAHRRAVAADLEIDPTAVKLFRRRARRVRRRHRQRGQAENRG